MPSSISSDLILGVMDFFGFVTRPTLIAVSAAFQISLRKGNTCIVY